MSSQKHTLHHSDLEEHLTSEASFPCPGSTSEVSGQESSHSSAWANDCTNSFVDDASQPESLDLTLCRQSPEHIVESELSRTIVSTPVFYLEKDEIPGICIDRGDSSFSWSPVKFSRSAVKVGVGSTESSDLDIEECVSIDYQPRHGVPGFEVETWTDTFWSSNQI